MSKKKLNHRVGINAWPSYGRYFLYQNLNMMDFKLSRN